jgi:hypothetical protein
MPEKAGGFPDPFRPPLRTLRRVGAHGGTPPRRRLRTFCSVTRFPENAAQARGLKRYDQKSP